MQNAPSLKSSGLKPLDDGDKEKEVVHVFGQNLAARVIAPIETDEQPSASNSTNEEQDISLLRKRKIDIITGEEDEETIFQGECKLFVWNYDSHSWTEKGRGLLKLNDRYSDDSVRHSRLIMRSSGTLQVMLNVALDNPLFKVITATERNIRFTDGQSCWAAKGNNTTLELQHLLLERIKSFKKLRDDSNNSTQSSVGNRDEQGTDSESELDSTKSNDEHDNDKEESVENRAKKLALKDECSDKEKEEKEPETSDEDDEDGEKGDQEEKKEKKENDTSLSKNTDDLTQKDDSV